MLSFLTGLISRWLGFESNPVDSILQGVVGACGISVLRSLLGVHVLIKRHGEENDDGAKGEHKQRQGRKGLIPERLQFWFVTVILAGVGSRVTSLVALEFFVRTILSRVTAKSALQTEYTERLLFQSQFSVGCALSCSLHFLQQGAPHSWTSLLLASALSWFLATQSSRLHHHAKRLFYLHNAQRYCGICTGLLTLGGSILQYLGRLLILIFSVAGIVAVISINQQFLSTKEAVRFWAPVTICYTLLAVSMQENLQQQENEMALQTVSLRLGGLMLLMLLVGHWTDMLHVFTCLLGEAACLSSSDDALSARQNGSKATSVE